MVEIRNIQGLDEIKRTLDSLPTRISEEVIKKTAYKEALVVRDDARRMAPIATKDHWLIIKKKFKGAKKLGRGFLKKGIVAILKKGSGLGEYIYQIGFQRAVWYGYLIEKGWIATGRKRKGMSITEHRRISKMFAGNQVMKHIPGRPFLRPAFDNNINKITIDFKNDLAYFIDNVRK